MDKQTLRKAHLALGEAMVKNYSSMVNHAREDGVTLEQQIKRIAAADGFREAIDVVDEVMNKLLNT